MRVIYWLASLLLFAALTLHTLPYVARDLVVYALLQQGVQSAQLKRVDIDWFNAKLELRQLSILHEDQTALSIDRLSFDIYLQELLDKRLRMSGLRLEGVNASLRQQEQLLLLGPIVLVGGEQSNASDDQSQGGYQFGSDRIELVDVDLVLAQLNSTQNLNIERLTVGGLYQWAPLEATDVRFVGHLNGAPITVDSSALPLPERKTLSIELALRQLDLAPLVQGFVPDFAASLDLNLSIDVALEGYNAWISQAGSLQLSNLELGVDASSAKLGTLAWQGTSSQQLNLQEGAAPIVDLAVKGLLTIGDLELRQAQSAAQALRLAQLNLGADLHFNPATEALTGTVGANLSDLLLTSAAQTLQTKRLELQLPKLAVGTATDVQLRTEALHLNDGAGQRVDVGELVANLTLDQQPGEPLWKPSSVTAALTLNQLQAAAAESQIELASVEAALTSSSLERVERLKMDANSGALSLHEGDKQFDLIGFKLGLNYDRRSSDGSVSLQLRQPSLSMGAQQISSETLNAELSGLVPADLTHFTGTLNATAEALALIEPDSQHSIAKLNLSSRVDTALPESTDSLSFNALEALVFNADLETLLLQSPELAGEVAAVEVKIELAPPSNGLTLSLRLDAPDLTSQGIDAAAASYSLQAAGEFAADLNQFDGTVELASVDASLVTPDLSASWKALNFKGPVSAELSDQALRQPLSLQGDLDLKQLKLQTDGNNLRFDSLSGGLRLAQQQGIDASAQLNLEGFNLDQGGEKLSLDALQTDLRLTGSRAKQLLSGSVSAADLDYKGLEFAFSAAAAEIEPKLSYSSEALELTTPVNLTGLSYQTTDLSAELASLSSALRLQTDPQLVPTVIEAKELNLVDLRAEAQEIIRLQQARVGRLLVAELENVEAEALELQEFSVGPQEAKLLSLSGLVLDRAKFSDNLLDVGELVTQNLQANLQTKLNTKGVSDAAQARSEPALADSSAQKRLPIDIKLQRFEAQGQTQVNYRDSSLASPLNLNLVASEFSAGAWDSRAGKALPIKLRAKLNASADLSIDASITPLDAKPSGEWSAQISALQMPILSPIIESFAGYQVRSGALNLESKGTLKTGQLEGDNRVRIERLEVQRAATDAANATDKLFTMPLPSAVSLLESDQRVIKLDLPLSGDINDPKFNYQDVIQIVVTKGVKQGATAYLTNALQPFGAIYMLYNTVKDVNESGRFIQLQALEFDLASSELNQVGRDYAAKLGGMMQDRPGLTLEICPVTLVAEEQILWEQLVMAQESAEKPLSGKALGEEWNQQIAGLASARIEALRSTLIRLDVANERIFPCISRNGATEGAPRVELAF